MIKDFTIYRKCDGCVLSSGSSYNPSGLLTFYGDGCAMVDKIADRWQYVKNGVVVNRPKFELVIDGLKVYNIPNGSFVYVDGSPVGECNTGEITLHKENIEDTISILFSLFPYIDKEVKL